MLNLMKQILIITLCLWGIGLFAINSIAQANVGSIEGIIIDHTTHQPLPGVNIMIVGTQRGDASDYNGRFFIENIPIGTYQLQASMMGYQTDIKNEIIISTNRAIMVNFELKQAILDLGDEVIVKASYFEKDNEKPISLKTLTVQEIRSSPGSDYSIYARC